MNQYLIASIILSIVSALYLRFKPQKRNAFYGYRTYESMKSPEKWELANTLAARLLLILSLVLLTVSMLNALVIIPKFIPLYMSILGVGLIGLFAYVEIRLRRN